MKTRPMREVYIGIGSGVMILVASFMLFTKTSQKPETGDYIPVSSASVTTLIPTATPEPTLTPIVTYAVKESYEETAKVVVHDKPATPIMDFSVIEDDTEQREGIMLFSIDYNMPIIKYISPKGNVYMIDVQRLKSSFYEAPSMERCGIYSYNRETNILYDFLVRQMGVEHNIACSIIGNCSGEGSFGSKQSSDIVISSIDDARKFLSRKSIDTGYGIVQWTVAERRERLLSYYESAVKQFSDFEVAQWVAEMVCLYEELGDYDLFGGYDRKIAIEDATGRIALRYERYKLSGYDWTASKDGTVRLTGKVGNGKQRLNFAYAVHKYYSETE